MTKETIMTEKMQHHVKQLEKHNLMLLDALINLSLAASTCATTTENSIKILEAQSNLQAANVKAAETLMTMQKELLEDSILELMDNLSKKIAGSR